MIQLTKLEKAYRSYFITKEDYEVLIHYYSQSVPFKGTSGKYSISPIIVYPRYKIRGAFESYNQNSVSKRSIAKNESYADYVVLPLTQFKQTLSSRKNSQNHPEHGEIWVFNWLNPKEMGRLTALIDFYNTMSKADTPKPMIDFDDFSSNLDALKERLTIPKTEYIINLLKGDAASMKLGMELLTNFDTMRSIVAICYCLSEIAGYNLRTHDYFNSTAFKSFRDRFTGIVSRSVDAMGGTSKPMLYEYIVNILDSHKDVTITATEYNMFKQIMCDYFIEKANNNDIILNITTDNITLKIDEDRVIPDENIEEEDRLRQEAALEDASSSYYLLDDTTEIA